MKRTDLEIYLGKVVEVKLFDGEIIRGCLRKTQDEMFKNDANLYLPKNYYFVTADIHATVCMSCLFRSSHVKCIKNCFTN